jgi:hypothetical protein
MNMKKTGGTCGDKKGKNSGLNLEAAAETGDSRI